MPDLRRPASASAIDFAVDDEPAPAGDLVRSDYGARSVINGPAEAHADAAEFIPSPFSARKKLRNRLANLPAYPVRPVRRSDNATPERMDRAVAIAQAKLELG